MSGGSERSSADWVIDPRETMASVTAHASDLVLERPAGMAWLLCFAGALALAWTIVRSGRSSARRKPWGWTLPTTWMGSRSQAVRSGPFGALTLLWYKPGFRHRPGPGRPARAVSTRPRPAIWAKRTGTRGSPWTEARSRRILSDLG